MKKNKITLYIKKCTFPPSISIDGHLLWIVIRHLCRYLGVNAVDSLVNQVEERKKERIER